MSTHMLLRSHQPSTTLISQANSNNLPLYQYMDKATHDWIVHNNPTYGRRASTPTTAALTILNKITLPTAWFASPHIADSIHGQRHLLRCAFLGTHIAKQFNLSVSQTHSLIAAAAIHDIRRTHDRNDTTHGKRSATWFRTNTPMLSDYWRVSFSKTEIDAITTAIALHDIPYENFTTDQRLRYEQSDPIVTDGVKLADALDRYRLPKLKWWINDAYLKLVPPPHLKQLAFDLVVASEQTFLQSHDSPYSVLHTVETI